MVSIVAHGILGTSYRRDIVVDGGAGVNGDLSVLCDIRRQISNEYDDGSPMIGWALQPAPSGMWLSRIERAFDLNYAPAYVEVSFLIPRGKRFDDAAAVLDMISNQMVPNYFKYIRQNVIQAMPDWSFLTFLGNELENRLVADYGHIAEYNNTPQYSTTCFSGNIYEMLERMWSEKFSCVGTVFCGDGLLNKNKEFVTIEDIEEETLEMKAPVTGVLEEESSEDETDELTEDEPMVADDGNSEQEDKSHVEFTEPACVYGPPVVDNESAHEPELINQKTEKWIQRIVICLVLLLIGFIVIIYTVSSKTCANDNKVESYNSYIAVDSNVIVVDRPILKPAEPHSQKKPDSYYKENYNKWKALFAKKEYEEALKCLLISAEGDYWEALSSLAYQYFRGTVYKHDIDLAEKYARRGAVLGYVDSQLWLGQILRETGRKAEALQWFEKSGKNQGWSAYLAGEMYENGEGTEKDVDKAIYWYKISAKNTNNAYSDNAQTALRRLNATIYDKNEYMESVRQVHVWSDLSPKEMYDREGKWWFNDKKPKQFAYLLKSAENGYPHAQEMLGNILVSWDAMELGIYDEDKSKEWLNKASGGYKNYVNDLEVKAKGGDSDAMEELGDIYRYGSCGKHKNPELAEKYYKHGAELGNETCQLWLGQIMRADGRKKEALYWFIKSGEQGQGWSAYLAGEMYEKGEGTEKDINKAIEWYTISAKTTNGYASNAREALIRLGQPVPKIGK